MKPDTSSGENKIPVYLEAALSFRSIKDLDKRYASFFNNVTMGYEAEIAVGDLDVSNDDDDNIAIDYGNLRQDFESEFSYSEDEYLQNKFRGALHIIEEFEVVPKYGFAKDKYYKPLSSLLRILQNKNTFNIMQKEIDGKILNYTPSYTRPMGWRDFRLLTENDYNYDYVIQKCEWILDLLTKFDKKYPISEDLAVTDFKDELTDFKKFHEELKTIEVRLKSLYMLCKYFNQVLNNIRNNISYVAMEDTYNSRISVLDEKGSLVVLKLDNKSDLQSDLLEFDQDKFEEKYQEEHDYQYEAQWESYEEDYADSHRENNSSNKNSAVEAIHRLVVDEVDEDAESDSGYHSLQSLKGKKTVVESDSSIEPSGAEVVSPVFKGVKESFVWLDKVFDMIENNDMETNGSTGLHVNIGTFRSLNMSTFEMQNPDKNHLRIDVLKLAVLSGDHYLLQQFGRLGNIYTQSLASNIRTLAAGNFDFKRMSRQGYQTIVKLNEKFLASQSDRYRTVNMQNLQDKGYLEFRVAGGENYHKDPLKIKKAIYRYVQLCAIACDRRAYFKEYMTELYRRFVDSTPFSDIQQIKKEPRPTNIDEAMYALLAWSGKYAIGNNEALPYKLLKEIKEHVQAKKELPLRDLAVLDLVSGLNTDMYSKVTNNFLYAMRILMLYAFKDEPNPRLAAKDHFTDMEKSIKNNIAPKLYRNKPQWVKFFYTGSMSSDKSMVASARLRRRSIIT